MFSLSHCCRCCYFLFFFFFLNYDDATIEKNKQYALIEHLNEIMVSINELNRFRPIFFLYFCHSHCSKACANSRRFNAIQSKFERQTMNLSMLLHRHVIDNKVSNKRTLGIFSIPKIRPVQREKRQRCLFKKNVHKIWKNYIKIICTLVSSDL